MEDSGFNNLRNDMMEDLNSRTNHGKSPLENQFLGLNPRLLVASLVGIVLILLIILMGRGPDKNIKRRINELSEKITQLEDRISMMDEQESKISEISKKINEMELSVREINSKLKRLSVELKKGISTSTKEEVHRKFHIVKRGDTLFSISRKYGIPLSELLRINNLKKGQSIHPGQKIYLK